MHYKTLKTALYIALIITLPILLYSCKTDRNADKVQAKEYLKRGIAHRDGTQALKDHEKAIEFFISATKMGDPNAPSFLYHMYTQDLGRNDKKDELTFRKEKTRALQGDVNAMINVGWMHKFGRGIRQDDEESLRWFSKAARRGNALAQNNVGFMHWMGWGVEANPQTALGWFHKAPDRGSLAAKFNLAIMYIEGIAIQKDVHRGIELLESSAAKGYAGAYSYLAAIYLNGYFGIKRDQQKALRYLENAANIGLISARKDLDWLKNILSKKK